jgi:hypothetical protein
MRGCGKGDGVYEGRLRKCEWVVLPVPLSVADGLVCEHHYAGGGSNTATFTHGLFRAGDLMRCLGVAWWIPPTKGAARKTWAGDWRRVLSLSRLVVLPGVPKNACSFLLARSVRSVRGGGAWECLVTYADTWRGHTGGIYRVSGWEDCGLTKPEAVWVDGRGRMVSRKAGPKTRTKAEMVALGCRCLGRFPKHKFRLVLTPPRPRRERTLFGGRRG